MEKEYTIDLKAIGERLKQVRTENNLKQSELADILRLGRTIVSSMEKGDSSPTLQTLFILKEKFNISIDWLMTGKTGAENIPQNEEDAYKLLNYYLQNFHYQTDGYLSDLSANLYDLQVEILFNGAADAMRRRIITPSSF